MREKPKRGALLRRGSRSTALFERPNKKNLAKYLRVDQKWWCIDQVVEKFESFRSIKGVCLKDEVLLNLATNFWQSTMF